MREWPILQSKHLRSGHWRDSLLIFLLVLMCTAYFCPRWADPNQNSRLDMVVAVVEDGTLRIDDYVVNTVDYAKVLADALAFGDYVKPMVDDGGAPCPAMNESSVPLGAGGGAWPQRRKLSLAGNGSRGRTGSGRGFRAGRAMARGRRGSSSGCGPRRSRCRCRSRWPTS